MRYTRKSEVKLDSERRHRYFTAVLPPTIEKRDDDIYVIAGIGERLDLLAWKYYRNVEYWWIIAAANPELRKDSFFIEPGTQVRVPKDYGIAINSIDEQNKAR